MQMLKLIEQIKAPSVQIGSWLGPIIFVIGFLISGIFGPTLAWLGVGLFALTVLFAVVTLPVELDASRRAKTLRVSRGLVTPQQLGGIHAVLDAAALTYVAGAAQAISTLLYYAFMLVGTRREETQALIRTLG